jgi:hypothetical protein
MASAEERVQAALHGEGEADRVVEESPEEVEARGAQRPAREADEPGQPPESPPRIVVATSRAGRSQTRGHATAARGAGASLMPSPLTGDSPRRIAWSTGRAWPQAGAPPRRRRRATRRGRRHRLGGPRASAASPPRAGLHASAADRRTESRKTERPGHAVETSGRCWPRLRGLGLAHQSARPRRSSRRSWRPTTPRAGSARKSVTAAVPIRAAAASRTEAQGCSVRFEAGRRRAARAR